MQLLTTIMIVTNSLRHRPTEQPRHRGRPAATDCNPTKSHASPAGAKEVIKVGATGNQPSASKERPPHGGREGEEDRSLCWGWGWGGGFEHMVSPHDTLEEGVKHGGGLKYNNVCS